MAPELAPEFAPELAPDVKLTPELTPEHSSSVFAMYIRALCMVLLLLSAIMACFPIYYNKYQCFEPSDAFRPIHPLISSRFGILAESELNIQIQISLPQTADPRL